MVHDRSNHLIVLVFLIFTPLKLAFHQHSPAVSSRITKIDRKNPSETRYIFEITSTPTRHNSDQKSTRNFYSENDNRNSPKFRTKSKNSLTTEEKRKQVDKVLSACRSEGKIAVTITEVNHAITTAGRLYRPDDAIEIFRSINKLGFRADLMTYNNIIWCVGNAGRFDISKSFFHELVARPDLKPNVYTYGALMHACAKIKGYKQALLYLGRSPALNLLCDKWSTCIICVSDEQLL
jgi:Pentatricopeptide repeat domain